MYKRQVINSVKELKGKTIYSTGQGANPEYVLRYVLEKNGLDPDKDVKLEFLSENDELATQLASGKAGVALVPEPVVTTVLTKNDKLRAALDMTQEWQNAAGDASGEVAGCIPHDVFRIQVGHPRERVSFCCCKLSFYAIILKKILWGYLRCINDRKFKN